MRIVVPDEGLTALPIRNWQVDRCPSVEGREPQVIVMVEDDAAVTAFAISDVQAYAFIRGLTRVLFNDEETRVFS